MDEADKDWMMVSMHGGWVNVSSGTGYHRGSPGQRAVKRLLLLFNAKSQSICTSTPTRISSIVPQFQLRNNTETRRL